MKFSSIFLAYLLSFSSKFSIFLCDETNKWIIKIKNKNSKNKIICDMNFEEVMLYINDNNIGK